MSTTAQDAADHAPAPAMRIVVNGAPRVIAHGQTLAGLIDALELDAERIAVEMNRRIVKRAEWPTMVLEDGSTLEIVQFVGGG